MTKEEERKLYSRYLEYAEALAESDPYMAYIMNKTVLGEPDAYEIARYEGIEYSEDISLGDLHIIKKEYKDNE